MASTKRKPSRGVFEIGRYLYLAFSDPDNLGESRTAAQHEASARRRFSEITEAFLNAAADAYPGVAFDVVPGDWGRKRARGSFVTWMNGKITSSPHVDLPPYGGTREDFNRYREIKKGLRKAGFRERRP